MADPAPTGTVVPAPQGGGTTTPEFKVPDGKVLIDASEQQTWQRQREQLAGLTRFHGEATKRGFKSPDDFGKYDKFSGVLQKRGMTLEQVQALLDSDGEPSTAEEVKGIDPAALDKYLAEKGYVNSKALDEREALIGAKFSHKEALAKEQAAMEKYVAELTGEKATDYDKRAIKAMLKEMAEEKRALYPQGHPLHDKELAPHDEKSLASFVEDIKKLRTLNAGAELAETGKEINRSARTTPAGATPSQGKPKDEQGHQSAAARLAATAERVMAGKGRG